MYRFHEFDRRDPSAGLPAGHVLGIEVTSPAQLALCTGNVDGQHGTGDVVHIGRAAVDIATSVPLPPDGAVLAATRTDVDSVGAMAVFLLRRLSADHEELAWPHGIHISTARARIALIAERDSFKPSSEWQPRPLPTTEQLWGEPTTVDSDRSLAHLGAICSPRPGDITLPLAERVAVMACWLLWGDMSPDYDASPWGNRETAHVIWHAAGGRDLNDRSFGLTNGTSAVARIINWIEMARIAVEAGRVRLAEEAEAGAVKLSSCNRIAIVRSRHAGALGLGYCVAPIVVAFDQAIGGKVTICGWAGSDGLTRYFDVPRLRATLNELEVAAGGSPTWGGPAALLGSPQVPGGTRLSEDVVIAAVSRAITC